METRVLKICETKPECDFPCCTITSKIFTVIFITGFIELRRKIQSKPWDIPNIKDYLNAIGGLKTSTVIDLRTSEYSIMLDKTPRSYARSFYPE